MTFSAVVHGPVALVVLVSWFGCGIVSNAHVSLGFGHLMHEFLKNRKISQKRHLLISIETRQLHCDHSVAIVVI